FQAHDERSSGSLDFPPVKTVALEAPSFWNDDAVTVAPGGKFAPNVPLGVRPVWNAGQVPGCALQIRSASSLAGGTDCTDVCALPSSWKAPVSCTAFAGNPTVNAVSTTAKPVTPPSALRSRRERERLRFASRFSLLPMNALQSQREEEPLRLGAAQPRL